jgi:hypothetical protein
VSQQAALSTAETRTGVRTPLIRAALKGLHSKSPFASLQVALPTTIASAMSRLSPEVNHPAEKCISIESV